MASDKIEYSRMVIKRTAQTGEVPTIPPVTAVTLNQMIPTDLFVGEFFLNETDDLLWIRTENGILPISLSGSTGSTPTLTQVLFEGNATNGYDIVVSSGDTIVFEGLNSGSTSTILGLDSSGNTITTSFAGTQDLQSVLTEGNTTGLNNIVVSSGATIQYEYLPTGATTQFLAIDADGFTVKTSGGADGTSGTSGINGTDGTSGTSGIGTNGTSGTDGTSGLSGVNGTNGTSGIDGTSGTDGTSGLSGVNGTNGTSGTSGIDGLSNSFFNYLAKTTITTGDPGTGHIIWNNAIQSDTTAIHISETDDNGNNVDIFFTQLQSGTTITIQDKASHLNYQTWLIGTPVDNSTYWELPVTLITSTHSFSNNDPVLFIVSSLPSGTSGTSGSSGTSGINGTDGFNGTSGTDGTSGTSGIGTNGTSGTSGINGTSGSSGSSGTSGGGSITYSNLTELPGQMVWNVLGAGSAANSRSRVAGGLMITYNQTLSLPSSSGTAYVNTIILEPGETLTTVTWAMQCLTGATISMGLYSLSAVTGNSAVSYTLGNLLYTITTGITFTVGTADRNITGLNYVASANTSPNNVYAVVVFCSGTGLNFSRLNQNNLIPHVMGGAIASSDYYRTFIYSLTGGGISGTTIPASLNTVSLGTQTTSGWFFTYKTQ